MAGSAAQAVDGLPDWTSRTVAILACGPSLVPGQVHQWLGWKGSQVELADVGLRYHGHATIAINDSFRLAPWADMLYAADIPWWERNEDAHEFAGLKVCVDPGGKEPEKNPERRKCPEDTIFLRRTGKEGFDPERGSVRLGTPKHSSGYQALHLAIQLGAARVLLLGYDCRGLTGTSGRFDFKVTVPGYEALLVAAENRGCDVVNVTPGSSLVWFRKAKLEEEL